MSQNIAIIGLACRYPDASNPHEMWSNVLAQRQAFRRIPSERTRLEDYFSIDPASPDKTYASQAAVLTDYEFDRNKYKISGKSFRAADLSHWLALDVAAQAIEDAGFKNGAELPKESTAVFVGNTLTGEFSRAQLMRLRWPYVRRTLADNMREFGWEEEAIQRFLTQYEQSYKAPFEPVNEETLAGGLSNTIAGRICNYFDLSGGGYTIDGACSSSLLAVVNGCNLLSTGEVDLAIVGGVDLSLDPFELVGFAKTGALAPAKMRVFDENSNGFIPGEGCGFAVLMRLDDAESSGKDVYATIKGWGVSSDGSGGLTRPEKRGQLLALNRAYQKAGYGIDTVQYFEAHGTGTSVGDSVELQTLNFARKTAGATNEAFVGSIKANIGHTKAAAGIAGLIKAAMAVKEGVIPPSVGCETPLNELTSTDSTLRIAREGRVWSNQRVRRSGVSSFGFGGINVHITIENSHSSNKDRLTTKATTTLNSHQDYELLLFGADSAKELNEQIKGISDLVKSLSRSELSDLGVSLYSRLHNGQYRAAIVVSDIDDAVRKLSKTSLLLDGANLPYFSDTEGIFLNSFSKRPSIGFLFPGQGSPVVDSFGVLTKRFRDQLTGLSPAVTQSVDRAAPIDTSIAQPAIVSASLAGIRALRELDIDADFSIGHSLGELVALHWAGAMPDNELIDLSVHRGLAMSQSGGTASGMASLMLDAEKARKLICETDVIISAYNSGSQTVISGSREALDTVVKNANQNGYSAFMLPVSHAFHSPYMKEAVPILEKHLSEVSYSQPHKTIYSTVTGQILNVDVNLKNLIAQQLELPVRFMEALEHATKADLLIEVGPGTILSGLARVNVSVPVVPLNVGTESFQALLSVVAASYVVGLSPNFDGIFGRRYSKSINLHRPPTFLENPCETAPKYDVESEPTIPATSEGTSSDALNRRTQDPLDVILKFVAAKTELDIESINPNDHLLQDLHLNSIAIGEIIAQSATTLGITVPLPSQALVTATIREIAEVLEQNDKEQQPLSIAEPQGVDNWVQPFECKWISKRLLLPPQGQRDSSPSEWVYKAIGDSDLSKKLETQMHRFAGRGLLVYISEQFQENRLENLFEIGKMAADLKQGETFVVVQHNALAGALARTVYLESSVNTLVLNIPTNVEVVDSIYDEVLHMQSKQNFYEEVHYDESLDRYIRTFEPYFVDHEDDLVLNSEDTILVTGGARGIGFECAYRLASKYGVKLGLIGRSDPTTDPELQINLNRLDRAGIDYAYGRADVTSMADVSNAINAILEKTGEITGIIHAAGLNSPKLFADLDFHEFEETVHVKVNGLKNVLTCMELPKLRAIITFGSVIAETGMHGEAHYAVANEWLANLTKEVKQSNSNCKVVCLEWSVWSDLGMGERLGSVSNLLKMGITPITPDVGVEIFDQIISSKVPSTLIVSGRFGNLGTVNLDRRDLPLSRFIEEIKVDYPKLELITDCIISPQTDPYIEDHIFDDHPIFPGVMGIEAMSAVAGAIIDAPGEVILESIEFLHPIVFSKDNGMKLRIRIAALRRSKGKVEVTIRSENTNFMMDHFRMTYIKSNRPEELVPLKLNSQVNHSSVNLNPDTDLYGGLLFQDGRFRRVLDYKNLTAFECYFSVDTKPSGWFEGFLPKKLCSFHPGIRDAAMHGIQPCIPHKRVLPISVGRVYSKPTRLADDLCYVHAIERSHENELYEYDLFIYNRNMELIESWEKLILKSAGDFTGDYQTNIALLLPYLERRFVESLDSTRDVVSIALVPNEQAVTRETTDNSIQLLAGPGAEITRRSDGKPEILNRHVNVSVSHTEKFTLVVSGTGLVGCDIEDIPLYEPSIWQAMLGASKYELAQYVSEVSREDLNSSCARLWSAFECLIKCGLDPLSVPLIFQESDHKGCVIFNSGNRMVCTFLVRTSSGTSVIALLGGDRS